MQGAQNQLAIAGALDGGSPMLHVDFKKWQCCPCHLFSPMSHVNFKKRLCHMSL